jgi:hypothetical protein
VTFPDALDHTVLVHGSSGHVQVVNIVQPALLHGLIGLVAIFDPFPLPYSLIIDFLFRRVASMVDDLLLHLVIEGLAAPA